MFSLHKNPRCHQKLGLVILLLFVFPVFGNEAQIADFVVVYKSKSKLVLRKGDRILAEYKVTFGANPKGPKQQVGDERTPEGRYNLDLKKSDSSFYKAIHISYPDEEDKKKALKRGVNPGGDIMIHGQRNGFGWLGFITQSFDWTDGCIALKNSDMDEIWQFVISGTPIQRSLIDLLP